MEKTAVINERGTKKKASSVSLLIPDVWSITRAD
jgi:hypothetical protein